MSGSPSVAVLGASGRMGRAVVRLAHGAGLRVACALGRDKGRDAGELAGIGPIGTRVTDDVEALATSGADVLVDFSVPGALSRACPVAAGAGIAIVSGTTGLDAATSTALDQAAARVPVLWEANMSLGVHVLAMLVERGLAALGPSFDVEIAEIHHRAKVDAPSGTALRLAEAVRAVRGGELVHGREGRPGPRKASEIGMHALRGGDVVGDHTVFMFGDGERLELTHRASSRDLFAHGALRAARWLVGRPAGRYRIADMMGG